VRDELGREITCLRVSVTDRCNLRCTYCMPAEGVPLLKRDEILSYEEIERVVRLSLSLGIRNVKLTGGEPLVRKDLSHLVRRLASIPGVEDLSLTTNGTLLEHYAAELSDAGLHRITVSLDTLDERKFRDLTREGGLQSVLDGIAAARRAGFSAIKVNTVVMRGINDEEVADLAEWAISQKLPIRFIEFMPRGVWQELPDDIVVPTEETFRRLSALDRLVPLSRSRYDTGPVSTYTFADLGGSIGFISPVTMPFCARCNRIRLTADGFIKPCLLHEVRLPIFDMLRSNAGDEEVLGAIGEAVASKPSHHPQRRSFPMNRDGG